MGSTPVNVSDDRPLDLSIHLMLVSRDKSEFVRAYFYAERQWVMEALPNMPEPEWEEYTQWVKSVMEPLGPKLISPDAL